MTEIIISEQAIRKLQPDQTAALATMCDRNKSLTKIHVTTAFDLPDGYVAFNQFFGDGRNIYGGISPKGEVST